MPADLEQNWFLLEKNSQAPAVSKSNFWSPKWLYWISYGVCTSRNPSRGTYPQRDKNPSARSKFAALTTSSGFKNVNIHCLLPFSSSSTARSSSHGQLEVLHTKTESVGYLPLEDKRRCLAPQRETKAENSSIFRAPEGRPATGAQYFPTLHQQIHTEKTVHCPVAGANGHK